MNLLGFVWLSVWALLALTVTPTSIRVYPSTDCTGEFLEVPITNSEDRCTSCWDACGKKYPSDLEVLGRQNSFLFPAGMKVEVYDFCAGTFDPFQALVPFLTEPGCGLSDPIGTCVSVATSAHATMQWNHLRFSTTSSADCGPAPMTPEQRLAVTNELIQELIVSPNLLVTTPQQARVTALKLQYVIDTEGTEILDALFSAFTSFFSKVYPSMAALIHAKESFEGNLGIVSSFNTQIPAGSGRHLSLVDYAVSTSGTTWLGVNTNSGLTAYDAGAVLLAPPPPVKKTGRKVLEVGALGGRKMLTAGGLGSLPSDLDWRQQNRIPSPKDQGLCASGWAFSGMLGLEFNLVGQNPGLNGPDASFSVQQVLDCANPATSNDLRSNGCNGGVPSDVGKFANLYGIVRAGDYPSVGFEQTCPAQLLTATEGPNPGPWVDWRVLKAEEMITIAEEGTSALALMQALQAGPVSTLMDASGSNFQLYAGGVFESGICSASNLNHAVTLVGYHIDSYSSIWAPQGYWIARNSFGPSWGIGGDIKIKMTAEGTSGMCGMYQYAYQAGTTTLLTARPNSPSPLGGSCSDDSGCQDLLVCQGSSGVCVQCQTDNECSGTTLLCDNGLTGGSSTGTFTCVTKKVFGEFCSSATVCASKHCNALGKCDLCEKNAV